MFRAEDRESLLLFIINDRSKTSALDSSLCGCSESVSDCIIVAISSPAGAIVLIGVNAVSQRKHKIAVILLLLRLQHDMLQ